MRHRLTAILADAPLLFIGAVVAIAVLFRVGIGLVRPASADPEAPGPAATTGALHEAPSAAASVTSNGATPSGEVGAGADTTSTSPVLGGGRLPRRSPASPDGLPPRKKARTHGRR